jgi:hypothetical protein
MVSLQTTSGFKIGAAEALRSPSYGLYSARNISNQIGVQVGGSRSRTVKAVSNGSR